ncbi:MAG: LysM peptidoglycan-binding domain-containing protein [Bacilli bacterium]|nr:LysM peptidoglycan-binding domain-containing protein [Bacilli bacterium]
MYKIYQVGSNETLDYIAVLFNTDIDELKKINGISDDMILKPGSFIIVPDNLVNDEYLNYTVKKGDSIYSISKKYDTDLDTLYKINGLNKDDYIYPDQVIKIPNKKRMYVTNMGDTLNDVLNNLDITIEQLVKENQDIYLKEDQLFKINR